MTGMELGIMSVGAAHALRKGREACGDSVGWASLDLREERQVMKSDS